MSLLSICANGKRWTDVYPPSPERDGQTRDVPLVLSAPCIPAVHPVPLGRDGQIWDVLPAPCIPVVHSVPLGRDEQTWDIPLVLPAPCILAVLPVPLGRWTDMGCPFSHTCPCCPSHPTVRDGQTSYLPLVSTVLLMRTYGMSLKSYLPLVHVYP